MPHARTSFIISRLLINSDLNLGVSVNGGSMRRDFSS
jgi:hypothetical protein